MDLVFALSLQAQVEKYGAYVGIAAFFGLAVLTVLYFAQAREVRRLRDYAGTSPERVTTLEERIAAQERAPARVQAQPAATATATAAPAAAAPAVAAPAPPARRGTIIHPAAAAIHVAKAARPNGAEAPAVAPAAATAAATASQVSAGQATAVTPAPPAPATPAGGPPASPPNGAVPPVVAAGAKIAALSATPRPPVQVPPRRPAPTAPSARRPALSAPASAGRSRRGTGLIMVGVVAALAGLVFLGIQFLGSDDAPAPAPNDTPPSSSADGNAGSTPPRPSAAESRTTATVSVLNGTTANGLANNIHDRLTGAGYPDGGRVDTGPDQTVAATTVYYASGQRRQATDAARLIGGAKIERMDADTQALAGSNAKLLVILGSDKAPG